MSSKQAGVSSSKKTSSTLSSSGIAGALGGISNLMDAAMDKKEALSKPSTAKNGAGSRAESSSSNATRKSGGDKSNGKGKQQRGDGDGGDDNLSVGSQSKKDGQEILSSEEDKAERLKSLGSDIIDKHRALKELKRSAQEDVLIGKTMTEEEKIAYEEKLKSVEIEIQEMMTSYSNTNSGTAFKISKRDECMFFLEDLFYTLDSKEKRTVEALHRFYTEGCQLVLQGSPYQFLGRPSVISTLMLIFKDVNMKHQMTSIVVDEEEKVGRYSVFVTYKCKLTIEKDRPKNVTEIYELSNSNDQALGALKFLVNKCIFVSTDHFPLYHLPEKVVLHVPGVYRDNWDPELPKPQELIEFEQARFLKETFVPEPEKEDEKEKEKGSDDDEDDEDEDEEELDEKDLTIPTTATLNAAEDKKEEEENKDENEDKEGVGDNDDSAPAAKEE